MQFPSYAELSNGEHSEANNCSPFEIQQYLYIHIYICLHVHCTRPFTPYTSPCKFPITSAHYALSFGALAAVWSTTLRSDPFARYGWRHQFSWRQPGRWQRLYSYRTQEAQVKPDCGTEGRTIGSQMASTYYFLYYFFVLYTYHSIYVHHLAYCIFTVFVYSFFVLLLIFQIAAWLRCEACACALRMPSFKLHIWWKLYVCKVSHSAVQRLLNSSLHWSLSIQMWEWL